MLDPCRKSFIAHVDTYYKLKVKLLPSEDNTKDTEQKVKVRTDAAKSLLAEANEHVQTEIAVGRLVEVF